MGQVKTLEKGISMKNSPQFLRTDKAIRQALITLLKNKPFEKITVQNILDETPVTRSTFYKHYYDKYEIVENMQEDFLTTLSELSKEIHDNPTQSLLSHQKLFNDNRELMNTLLKVHTEKVDLMSHFSIYSEAYYLEHSNDPDKYMQAKIYAQMITAFTLADHSLEHTSLDYMRDTIISIMLFALNIPEDNELRELLKSKSLSK